MDLKNQIHDYLQEHKKEIVDTLKKLIKIPSARGEAEEDAPFGRECARALEFTQSLYESNGFDTELDSRGGYLLSYYGEGKECLGFENGRAVNVGKSIVNYKFGSEYASGGAGGISTVDDYIRFLEALRTHRLLKPETLELMTTDRLTDEQKRTYWLTATHGYGLGVRCPDADRKYADFGWGGAACAYLAVDVENKISLYFGAHLLSSPAQGLRSMLYRFVHAELIAPERLEGLYKDLKDLHNYSLTY